MILTIKTHTMQTRLVQKKTLIKIPISYRYTHAILMKLEDQVINKYTESLKKPYLQTQLHNYTRGRGIKFQNIHQVTKNKNYQ